MLHRLLIELKECQRRAHRARRMAHFYEGRPCRSRDVTHWLAEAAGYEAAAAIVRGRIISTLGMHYHDRSTDLRLAGPEAA